MADVVELIKQDHREFERMFQSLRSDPAARPGLVPVLTTLLAAHSRAEESEVYPVVAGELDASDDVAHSQEEHIEADQLLEQLASCDPEGTEFEEVLEKLVESITHHLEEEETTVLPHMSSGLDDQRRADLGEAFLRVRQEHLGDQPDDITKSQLQQQAANAEIGGTAGLAKDELQDKLRDEAGSE